jgi:hypothetical protein
LSRRDDLTFPANLAEAQDEYRDLTGKNVRQDVCPLRLGHDSTNRGYSFGLEVATTFKVEKIKENEQLTHHKILVARGSLILEKTRGRLETTI